jgi:hypothetical protein
MATTQTVLGIDQVKGQSLPSNLRAVQFAVRVSGTYDSAGRPNFDVLAALQNMKKGVSAVAVKTVSLLRDHVSSAGVVNTAPNANIALSGTGNKTVTFRIYTGGTAANGDAGTGAEVADTTSVDMTFVFLAVLTETT